MNKSSQQELLLPSQPTLLPKISLLKNVICFLVAALAFFLAAIFIVARFYSNRVEAGIAEVSLLKE